MTRRQCSSGLIVQNRRSKKSDDMWVQVKGCWSQARITVRRQACVTGICRGGPDYCGRMCEHITRDRSSLVSLFKWTWQIEALGIDTKSLRIALDLGGIGSADGTGSVSLEWTKTRMWGFYSLQEQTNMEPCVNLLKLLRIKSLQHIHWCDMFAWVLLFNLLIHGALMVQRKTTLKFILGHTE